MEEALTSGGKVTSHPGFPSPVYELRPEWMAAIETAARCQLDEFAYELTGINDVSPSLADARAWPLALMGSEPANRKTDVLRLAALADEASVDAGFARAQAYLATRILTWQEVQALTLRNLYYLHNEPYLRQQRNESLDLAYYFGQLAFLAFVLVAWDWLQQKEPVRYRRELRLS